MPFSERTQVLLTPDQRARLERLAARRGVSVGSLIREAVDALIEPGARSPAEALRDLCALDAPVDDWAAMESEIISGATP